MANNKKHVMEFKSHADLTTATPTVLRAHKLTRKDLERYDANTGHFRLQGIRFQYTDVKPKVGEYLVRFDDEFKPVATGIVVLVGAARFLTIVGDVKGLNQLGQLEDAA